MGNAYFKISKGEKVEGMDILKWYKDKNLLLDSLKTEGYYIGTLLMWFTIYVLFPMGVFYMFWGRSLKPDDGFLSLGILFVLFTAVILVASLPYFIHMLRYSGGLFYCAQETHLDIKMRFDIGKDFIAPHAYRYALICVTFLPYMLLSFCPIIISIIFSDFLGIFAYPLGIFGYAFMILVFLPYFNMTSMLMFERMQNPKKEIKYDIK